MVLAELSQLLLITYGRRKSRKPTRCPRLHEMSLQVGSDVCGSTGERSEVGNLKPQWSLACLAAIGNKGWNMKAWQMAGPLRNYTSAGPGGPVGPRIKVARIKESILFSENSAQVGPAPHAIFRIT